MHLNSSTDKNPPVFAMNLHYSGVGIARNLYGQGVKIYGLSNKRSAFGNSSRLFGGIYRVPDDAEGLCRRILDLRRNHEQAPVLFPTRDLDVIFLHQYRKQLSSSYRIAQSNEFFWLVWAQKMNLPQKIIAKSSHRSLNV